MQPNLFLKATSSALPTTLRCCTGHLTQVRNHVKVYPWRRNRLNRECYLDPAKTPYTDRFNVNEFISEKKQRKDWQKVIPKDKDNRFNTYRWNSAYKSDPKEAKETADSKLKRFQHSLMDRGSAREMPAYNPPTNVEERIVTLYRAMALESGALHESGATTSSSTTTTTTNAEANEDVLNVNLNQSRSLKFNLLTKCIDEFCHDLPNSYLNDIETIRDLVGYFSTPVRGINPYSAMLRQEDSLPANLSLIAEPIRFDKHTDTMFKGVSAYPGIVSKVPGLRAAKKYPVLNQDEFQWPDI